MRRWVVLTLATCGVTAAIAVPLLAGSGMTAHPARPSVTVEGSGSAQFYPLNSPAYRRFCNTHRSICAVMAAHRRDHYFMYSPATAVLVGTCYRGKCKRIDSATARRLCKEHPQLPRAYCPAKH